MEKSLDLRVCLKSFVTAKKCLCVFVFVEVYSQGLNLVHRVTSSFAHRILSILVCLFFDRGGFFFIVTSSQNGYHNGSGKYIFILK